MSQKQEESHIEAPLHGPTLREKPQDQADDFVATNAGYIDPKKERRLLLKLDAVILPMTVLLYLSANLDVSRGNAPSSSEFADSPRSERQHWKCPAARSASGITGRQRQSILCRTFELLCHIHARQHSGNTSIQSRSAKLRTWCRLHSLVSAKLVLRFELKCKWAGPLLLPRWPAHAAMRLSLSVDCSSVLANRSSAKRSSCTIHFG